MAPISSTGPRRLLRVPLALLALIVAGCLGAPAALAATGIGHAPLTPITGEATPEGALEVTLHGAAGIDEDLARLYISRSEDFFRPGAVNIFDLASGAYLGRITNDDLVGVPLGTTLNPNGPVAVDNSGGSSDGNVYVASANPETGKGRIFVFDSSGTYLRTMDGSDTPAGSFAGPIGGMTVDRASGDLLVTDSYGYVINRFGPGGSYLSQIVLDPATGEPATVDLDSAGNLYLARYGARVEKYGPAGNLLGVVDDENPQSVAVDPNNDHVYVGGKGHIAEYDSAGAFVSRFGNGDSLFLSALRVDGSTGRLYDTDYAHISVYAPGATVTIPDVGIDPVATGDVGFVDATVRGTIDPDGAPSLYFVEYRRVGSSSWSRTPFEEGGDGSGPVPVAVAVSGLQADTEYEARLIGASGGREASAATGTVSFKTKEAIPPALTIDPVTAITVDAAHFSGTADPEGIPTKARFEYSEDGSNWTSLPAQDVGSGTSPVAIEGDVIDLDPNTHYVVRLRADNPATASTSGEVGFDTLAPGPNAFTMGAAPRTQTTARLHAYVNTRKSVTKYHFEFGSDSSYGSVSPTVELAAVRDQKSVSYTLTGLQPGATYHYRVVAENAAGVATGEDVAFTTRTAAETGPRARGTELVNNPEKGNQPARPGGGNLEEGVVASRNADRILWSTVGGAPGGSLGTGSIFMAKRGPDGWRSANILPPREQLVAEGEATYAPVFATPSFDRVLYSVQSGVNDISTPVMAAANDDGSGQRVYGPVRSDWKYVYRANNDLSHVYSLTMEQFDPRHPANTVQLYDYSYDPPQLVSLEPNGTASTCGLPTDGGYRFFGGYSYEWVSTDPAALPRAFFEAEGDAPCSIEANAKVFMRDQATQTTTLLTGPALPGGPQSEDGAFIRANSAGTEALFIADSRLTPEDDNDVKDIYRYSDAEGRECLTCVGRGGAIIAPPGSLDSRNVPVSSDLSYVYFASPNVLVPGVGEQGRTNIYLYHEGQIRYVAPGGKLELWTTELTDGGKVLFFQSESPEMTNDDTNGFNQVYRYDAEARSLECVSCVPGVTSTAPVLGNVPLSSKRDGFGLSAENGDAFVFSTWAALDRRDINQATDIYEWRNGEVKRVTDGVGEPTAGNLIGQGKDGINVLFTSVNNLTGFERDNTGQLYVARVGGGFTPPTPPADCEAGDCQGPLQAPPGFAQPGSNSLNGAGNERNESSPRKPKTRKCAKGRKAAKSSAGKTRCAKPKQAKKKKAKNASKAKSNRGAK